MDNHPHIRGLTFHLPPERVAQDAMDRAQATPAVMKLARMLQSLAFGEGTEMYGEDFRPAPLYMRQATVLAQNSQAAFNLVDHLWTVHA